MRAVKFSIFRHYPLVALWWHQREFESPSPEALPANGFWIENSEGQGVAAGFLFLTDSPSATIHHLVSNPEASGEERHQALDFLIESLMEVARLEGKSSVTAASNLERVIERYERLGFHRMDQGIVHVGRNL